MSEGYLVLIITYCVIGIFNPRVGFFFLGSLALGKFLRQSGLIPW